MPDSTSEAITGSSPGSPRFLASPAIQAAICSGGASSPGYSVTIGAPAATGCGSTAWMKLSVSAALPAPAATAFGFTAANVSESPGRRFAGAAASACPGAARSPGGLKSGEISSLKPTWRWSWWPASVK